VQKIGQYVLNIGQRVSVWMGICYAEGRLCVYKNLDRGGMAGIA